MDESSRRLFMCKKFVIVSILIYYITCANNRPYVIDIASKGNYPETITFVLYKDHTLKVTVHNRHPVLLKCTSANIIDSSHTNIRDIYQPVIYHIINSVMEMDWEADKRDIRH